MGGESDHLGPDGTLEAGMIVDARVFRLPYIGPDDDQHVRR